LPALLFAAVLVLVAGFAAGCVMIAPQRYSSFTTPAPLPPDSWLVIGFLGGAEHWNSEVREVRKLALDLRARNLPGVHAETVENHRRGLAMELVEKAFDRNGDDTLDPAECAAARIILYGHSFGGAAVVKFARELKARGISVALTAQVDIIGADGTTIPSNVSRAVNFYQHDALFLRGRRIHAEDPAHTAILGNFRIELEGRKSDVPHPGVRRMETIFGGAHTKLGFDQEVWNQVEKYIMEEIQRADTRGSQGLSGPPQQSEPRRR
jgi:hypothetical protein